MSLRYWSQFDSEEIQDMLGIEDVEQEDCEIEEIEDHDESEPYECPKCMDSGCNYCLMTEW